jgi:hypothetical protein
MPQLKPNQVTDPEPVDSSWMSLYKVGGGAALMMVVLFPIQIIIYVVWPPPSTAIDYFALFQNNKLLGLLSLDLLLVVDQVLAIPLTLALYIALRRTSESLMAIALTLGFVAIAAYFASNTAFSMLSLSDQYAVATTDAQRSMLLAAGQAMLAVFNGTAFHVYYVLGSIAPLIVSVVMLRGNIFSKVTAYMGILASVIGLGLYVPTIGIFISIFSVLFYAIWYILIARKLFQLG